MSAKLHSAPQTSADALGNSTDDTAPIILHPLVVLNVSDHYTRYAAMRLFANNPNQPQPSADQHGLTDDQGNPRVIGILLGSQRGRTVEICHSVELKATAGPDGAVVIDRPFMQSRLEQYQQIFSQYIVVGWYTSGTRVSAQDLQLHEDVLLNEAPILLVINAAHGAVGASGLPGVHQPGSFQMHTDSLETTETPDLKYAALPLLSTYHVELKMVEDKPMKVFAILPHRYASEDSERIAVDHVMRHAVPGGDEGTSSTTLHLATLRGSIKMLQSRLRLIVAFLDATASSEIPVDFDLLRQIAGVCARLPALDCSELTDAFAVEKNDSLVVSYLAGVTKTLCSLNEALDMFGRLNLRPTTTGPPRRRSTFLRS